MVKKSKPIAILVALVAVAAITSVAYWSLHQKDSDETNPYALDRMNKSAQSLVEGLNRRDPGILASAHWSDDLPDAAARNAAFDRMIVAAMPLSGCQYAIDNVQDRGRQPDRMYPWGATAPVWRYDVKVWEKCPDRRPVYLVIGVLAVPGPGAHWVDTALILESP